jgi:hypothetical protein
LEEESAASISPNGAAYLYWAEIAITPQAKLVG